MLALSQCDAGADYCTVAKIATDVVAGKTGEAALAAAYNAAAAVNPVAVAGIGAAAYTVTTVADSYFENQTKQAEEQTKQAAEHTKQAEEKTKQAAEQTKQAEAQAKQAEEQTKQAEEQTKQAEAQAKQAEEQTKQAEELTKQLHLLSLLNTNMNGFESERIPNMDGFRHTV